jgi:integrase
MKINMKIKVSFYLKSTSKKLQRKAIYANIRFAGKQKQFATGLFCEDPDVEWKRGGFVGRKRTAEQAEMLDIINTIEGFDPYRFRDIDQIWDQYNGEGVQHVDSTILEALNWALEQKKKESNFKENTYRNNNSAVTVFKNFIESNKKINSNFSLIRKNPRQMFKRNSIDFRDYLLDKENTITTIHARFTCLKALYTKYHKFHNDMIDDLILNPFQGVLEQEKPETRRERALKRAIPWHFIEKISFLDKKQEQYRAMAMFQAYTGISWKDFGKKDVLNVTQTIKGKSLIGRRAKSGQDYVIDLSLAEDHLNYLKVVEFPFEHFIDDNLTYLPGKKLLSDNEATYYNKFLSRVLAPKIGLDDGIALTSHRFRHTFAMTALNIWRIDIQDVAKMMGDKIETVLATYADLSQENILERQRNCFDSYVKSASH